MKLFSQNRKMLIVNAFIAFAALYFIMENAMHVAFSYMIALPATMEGSAIPLSNILLLSNYSAVAAGMSVWAIIPVKALSERTRDVCFRASAGLAAILSAITFFTSGTLALGCKAGVVLSSALALGLLLRRLPGLLPPGRVGLFAGCGLALTGFISFFMFSSPFWDARLPLAAFIAVLTVFAVLAMIIPLPAEAAAAVPADAPKCPAMPMSPRYIAVLVAILLLCKLVPAIMTDQLFYFYEVFYQFEHFGSVIIIAALAMEVFSGFLFDKGVGAYGFLTGFLLMGASQAMALFFGETAAAGIPYYVFEYLGSSMLMVFLIATPIYYAALGAQRKRGIVPQLGFICQYMCALVVVIAFQMLKLGNMESGAFDPALGTLLLLTLLGITLSLVYLSKGERHRRNALEQQLKENTARLDISNTSLEEQLKTFGFTNRETQVMRLLLDGADTSDIAQKMVVTEKTVQNYVSSLLSKTGTKSRLKLVAIFNRQKR